ncbi:MAG: TolC family protein [Deltaproteobacteria bacterium]|nr:MAG: TolC family protein [Deltaproteobacteria bacterium]
MKMYLYLLFLIFIVVCGCAVGPEYKPAKTKLPEKWYPKMEGGVVTSKDVKIKEIVTWWQKLKDPELSKLIDRAVKGNLNVKEALARLKEERALRKMEKSRLFPYLDSNVSITKEKMGGMEKTSERFSMGIDASWEADIFGGIRRSIQEAEARLEAAKEDLRDVIVSLLAEVAINYVELRTYQARLEAVRSNAEAQDEIYRLNLSRYRAGLIDELAVQQSRYVLENTRSQIPPLQEGIERAKNRLSVLLGKNPGVLDNELKSMRPIPVPPVKVVIGIPANTLRNRPDIRRAEMDLVAATYAVGKAKAELYPKLDLSGSIGLESLSHGDFLKWASRTWSFGANIGWKIFHAGELRQNVKVYTARQEQAFLAYQNAILKALEEVRNAIIAYAKEQKRCYSLQQAVNAARKTYELALDRYKAGLVDFTDVLDAERALQSLQDQLSISKGAVITNLIRLYKALGGGWQAWKVS